MSHFEFVLPLNKEDLRTADDPSQYHVSDLVDTGDLNRKIEECRTAIQEEGFYFIVDHFDTLYTVLVTFRNMKWPVLQRFFKNVLIRGLKQLQSGLQLYLESGSTEENLKALNATKMMLYVYTDFVKCLSEKITECYDTSMLETGKGRKKATSAVSKLAEEFDWYWEDDQREGFELVHEILAQPIHKLWDPPVADEEFVNMIANCCYRTLEDPTIAAAKSKPLRDILFKVIAQLIKKYNHGLSCTVKIVQLIKLYEHLITPLAHATVMFVTSYGCKSLVREIVREITDSKDSISAEDTSTTRAFSAFLVAIASCDASLIRPVMSNLVQHLESDPYTMRNCVLTILAELLVKVLKGEELDEEAKEERDEFFDYLMEHIVDIAALVRSKVLQLWQDICRSNALPKHRTIPLLEAAIERLSDKSVFVSKNAIQLIKIMLERNPFAAKLGLEELQKQYDEEQQRLQESEKQNDEKFVELEKEWDTIKEDLTEFLKEETKKEYIGEKDGLANTAVLSKAIQDIKACLKERDFEKAYSIFKFAEEKFLNTFATKSQDLESDDKVDYLCHTMHLIWLGKLDEADIDTENRKAVVLYLEDCIKFVKCINQAIPIICRLLLGKQTSEVLEAIDFFTAAKQFGLHGAEKGVCCMLALVHSKEQGIKEAVTKAYKTLYLDTPAENPRTKAVEIVRKLSDLLRSVTVEQQFALEEFIKEWVKDRSLDKNCIMVMWERFSKKLEDTSDDDSRAALALLTMAASAEVQIVRGNIDVLISQCLAHEERQKDLLLVMHTCKMLLKLNSGKNKQPRFPADHEIFVNLTTIILNDFEDIDNKFYTPMVFQGLNVIYELSDTPDITCSTIVKSMCEKLKNSFGKDKEGTNPDEFYDTFTEPVYSEKLVARLVAVVCHIAFRQWQYLDGDVFKELKYRNTIREEKKRKSKKYRNKSVLTPSGDSSISDPKDQSTCEEGEGIAAADDAAQELIRKVCESEIVTGKGLLAVFCPMILHICQNPQVFSGEILKSVASAGLSKLMMVSSTFCEDQIQLFVTMLERSPEPAVRTNLVLAFGDFLFRFPNLIEPWTHHLYARLRDESSSVRLNTLLVLSHLITNEMVKVKGQISDVALCMVDEDPIIKDKAQQFFTELSGKGNTLYNVMPDIISRLSNPDQGVTEENFQIILRFLMELINKEKQVESLVEKLCHRFRGSNSERQWRDLSFCLTLMPINERSLFKLIDNFSCFADKLTYPPVHKNFEIVIGNVSNKNSKQNVKDLLTNFKQKIERVRTKGIDSYFQPIEKSSSSDTPGGKSQRSSSMTPATVKKSGRPKRLKKIVMSSPEESSGSSNESDEEPPRKVPQKTPRTNPRRRVLMS
nr:PREDICTED: condensin complex subunit 1 [Bemisia tabaci]